MKLGKRIFNSDLVRYLVCFIAAFYIRLVYLTGRWTVVGGAIPKEFWDSNRPFIVCFWHGRLLMLPYGWNRKKQVHILASNHKDGRLISETISQFGIKSIAGSTSKGGMIALRTMIRTLKGGEWVGITPDGPRGPRMRATDGVITLARMTKMPIIPLTYSIRRRKVLGSWDRFIVALPFSRGVFVWGDPIIVPHTANKEALENSRLEVEQAINALCDEADAMCGHAPIKPADAP